MSLFLIHTDSILVSKDCLLLRSSSSPTVWSAISSTVPCVAPAQVEVATSGDRSILLPPQLRARYKAGTCGSSGREQVGGVFDDKEPGFSREFITMVIDQEVLFLVDGEHTSASSTLYVA